MINFIIKYKLKPQSKQNLYNIHQRPKETTWNTNNLPDECCKDVKAGCGENWRSKSDELFYSDVSNFLIYLKSF